MTIQLTIIGLGEIGASIGMALRGTTRQLTRTGYDRSMLGARRAKELDAVDKVEHNLHAAVEKADIVLLAIPVDEIHAVLEQIRQDLQPGAVVLDTSPVKSAAAKWAKELLPEECHFVSFMPTISPAYLLETLSGLDAAHADLFKDSPVLIDAPPETDPDAVKLASDLATLIGAKAMFVDRLEADGLTAATRQVPELLAAAMINAQLDNPGWNEGRKAAGKAFSLVTQPLARADETHSPGKSAVLNHENVVRVINDVITELENLRDAIDVQDEETLANLLKKAQQGREKWWQERQSGTWERTKSAVEMPTGSDVMSRFFGFRRKKKE